MSVETPTSESGDEGSGPMESWASRAIQNPERVYRAMFYVITAFFLITTLFPFYWLLVLAVTPQNAPGLNPFGSNPMFDSAVSGVSANTSSQ